MPQGKYTVNDLQAAPSQKGKYTLADVAPQGQAQASTAAATPTPVPSSSADAQPTDWYGFKPMNIAKNLYQGAKGAVEGTYALGKDLAQNPNWFTGDTSTLNKFVLQPAAQMKEKAQTAKTPYESLGYSVAEAIPFVGPWAAQLGEQAGKGDIGGAAASGAGTLAAFKTAGKAWEGVKSVAPALKTKAIALQEARPFIEVLQDINHDNLTTSMMKADQKISNARNVMSQREGKYRNDIIAPDYAKGSPGTTLSDMPQIAEKIRAKYHADPGQLAGFESAVQDVTKLGSDVWLDQLLKKRTDIGRLWNKMPDGADSSAVLDLREELTKKAQQRAADLGPQSEKAFSAYNDEWKMLQEYMDKGVLGQLLNKKTGYEFFDTLRDPKTGGQVSRAFDFLEKRGALPKNYKGTLLEANNRAYDYLSTSSAGASKWRAVLRRPVAATAGAVAGSPLGPIGAGVGAIKAAQVADALEGLRAVQEMGIQSRKAEPPSVEPVGTEPQRQPAPGVWRTPNTKTPEWKARLQQAWRGRGGQTTDQPIRRSIRGGATPPPPSERR